jgi:hypothetical protein
MDQKLKNKLKKAQNNWEGARTRANESTGFTEVPDGRYLAHLTGAQIGESKSSGRLQIQWTWTIADGEFEGDTKLDFDGLETEDNLVFLGRKLARFSYELPEDITAISDILDELIEKRPLARIRLKTRGEFQNVYVDKLMRSVDGDEDTDDSNDVGSDDDVEDADGGVVEEPEEESDDESDNESDDESDDDESDDEESDDEEQEVEVGMRVIASTKKGDAPGEIVEIIEDEGKVRVHLDEGRTVKISVDKLEAEPIQQPPKKARKRPKNRS